MSNRSELRYWGEGLPAGLPGAPDGEGLWAALAASGCGRPLEAHLDELFQDRPAPRVWLLLHRPGGEQASAVAAAALAAACAARQQSTVIVDLDEDESLLTRRSGRADQDGMLDMARYGASLAAAGVRIGWSGRAGWFLGVGSYTPTEITEAEAAGALSRLRHQADDLILVCPSGEPGRRWAAFADLRFFCWDRSQDVREIPDLAAAELAGIGRPLSGVLPCGDLPAAVPDAPVAPAAPTAADAAPVAPAAPPAAAAPLPDPYVAPHAMRRRRSSSVFRVAALVVLGLIVILAAYYWKYVQPDAQAVRHRPPQPQATTGPDRESAPVTVPDEGAVLTDPLAADSTAGGTGAATGPQTPADSSAAALVVQAPGAEDQGSVPEGTGPAAEPVVAPIAETDFDASPYAGEVGAAGWAIHLSSLADSLGGLKEVARLEGRGIRALMRSEDVSGRRWFRVYVGSFATRREASAAADSLKVELATDYAQPRRLPVSASE
ncbi:MAG: SPOR domain-containing protein [Candidatus Krumholzibacteriia bacterium]